MLPFLSYRGCPPKDYHFLSMHAHASPSSQTSARPVNRDLCVRCLKNNTAPYAALSSQSSMLIKSTQTAFFIFWTLES